MFASQKMVRQNSIYRMLNPSEARQNIDTTTQLDEPRTIGSLIIKTTSKTIEKLSINKKTQGVVSTPIYIEQDLNAIDEELFDDISDCSGHSAKTEYSITLDINDDTEIEFSALENRFGCVRFLLNDQLLRAFSRNGGQHSLQLNKGTHVLSWIA